FPGRSGRGPAPEAYRRCSPRSDAEELPRARRVHRIAPDALRVGGGSRDEGRAALGEHALREVDVVLETDAGVAGEPDRELRHRLLVPADRGDGPRGAGGDLRRHEADHVLARADAARDAQHELEVQRLGDVTLAEQRERLVDVADLVALELDRAL